MWHDLILGINEIDEETRFFVSLAKYLNDLSYLSKGRLYVNIIGLGFRRVAFDGADIMKILYTIPLSY